jgi:hypothetical protein
MAPRSARNAQLRALRVTAGGNVSGCLVVLPRVATLGDTGPITSMTIEGYQEGFVGDCRYVSQGWA